MRVPKPHHIAPSASRFFGPALVLLLTTSVAAHGAERLALEATSVDLPAAPAVLLSADLDSDGLPDLVAGVVHVEWDQHTVEERQRMDEVEGLVEVLTIVPVLEDRREVWILRGTAGGWATPGIVLPLAPDVHALLPGPPAAPVLALTDAGVSRLRWIGGAPGLEPWIEDPPVFRGSRSFLPDLPLTVDLNGDGFLDLLLPTADDLAVYLADRDGALRTTASSRVAWPPGVRHTPLVRRLLLPTVRDVDGDGRVDLLFPDPEERWQAFRWSRSGGEGRFAPPSDAIEPPPECSEASPEDARGGGDEPCRPPGRVVWVGDLDGSPGAEFLTREGREEREVGLRKGLEEAKRPPFRYRVHPAAADLRLEPEPLREFDALGYTFAEGDDDVPFPGGLQDLDGDGDLDLVAVTLDFSLLQAARVMTVGTFGLGLDFHLFCQTEPGRFEEVEGLDLSGKLRLHLDDVRLSHRSLFGDFDGDGRADFVQLGRGRDVAIHLGREGCRVSPAPDVRLRLETEPSDLSLVRIHDLDGDGRSDLSVVLPGDRPEDGTSRGVRLEVYRGRTEGSP